MKSTMANLQAIARTVNTNASWGASTVTKVVGTVVLALTTLSLAAAQVPECA